MRLPYTPPESKLWNPAATRAILSRRALRPDAPTPQLLPLDRALLHSPPLALGWNALLGALRDAARLPQVAFELAAVRVAALAGARFEWDQHAPLLRKALAARGDDEHAVDDVLAAVRDARPGAFAAPTTAPDAKLRVPIHEGEVLVKRSDAAVLAVVDAMTRRPEGGLDEEEWKAAREAVGGGEREAVELVAAIAAYNMVARFLIALDVGERGSWHDRLRGGGSNMADTSKAKL